MLLGRYLTNHSNACMYQYLPTVVVLVKSPSRVWGLRFPQVHSGCTESKQKTWDIYKWCINEGIREVTYIIAKPNHWHKRSRLTYQDHRKEGKEGKTKRNNLFTRHSNTPYLATHGLDMGDSQNPKSKHKRAQPEHPGLNDTRMLLCHKYVASKLSWISSTHDSLKEVKYQAI